MRVPTRLHSRPLSGGRFFLGYVVLGVLSLPAIAAAGTLQATLSPLSGPAPLTVHATALATPDGHRCHEVCARFDFGTGDAIHECGWLYPCDPDKALAAAIIDEERVLACPGTYTVTAYVDPYYCASCPVYTWEVIVGDPEYTVSLAFGATGRVCRFVAAGNLGKPSIGASTIDWGDGSEVEHFAWQGTASPFESPWHFYPRDGEFEVRIVNTYVGNGCQWDEVREISVQIDSEPPVAETYPIYANDGRTCKMIVTGDICAGGIAGSTVDWGDGTPIQEFWWRRDIYGLETPYHDYAQDGEYTVRIVSTQVCGYPELVLTAVVSIAGNTTPVQATTWGRVKALYRK